VIDLHRRLAAAGYDAAPEAPDVFAPATTIALRAFQAARGLESTGSCDRATWFALVEAGYRLGDRALLRRSPMMRGDDVADLQRLLGGLGFDCGRVDGIFGPDTARALGEFQRNVGLTADEVCGPATVAALERLGQRGEGRAVQQVRERVRLEAVRGVRPHLTLGSTGGWSSVHRRVAAALRRHGVTVVGTDDPDPLRHADIANGDDATAYVGLVVAEGRWVAYYANRGTASVGGELLARRIADHLAEVGITVDELRGRQIPPLRETRMPAVIVGMEPSAAVLARTDALAEGIASGILDWLAEPIARRPHPVHRTGETSTSPRT
jgi:N-acetylmuramoyl-L-alanine amidase